MSAGHPAAKRTSEADSDIIGAIVFDSDQGLVGQSNEEVADFAIKTLASLPGKLQVWAVGERVRERLADAGLPIAKSFAVPTNVNAIAPLRALIREYLFISLYRACAESLASENASRLAAMQRAEKNIDELLEDLASKFHQLRQSSIDEELFDVVAGYELLGKEQGH